MGDVLVPRWRETSGAFLRRASIATTFALAGCGGVASSRSTSVPDGASEASDSGDAGVSDATASGECVTDDDCVAVLDYREGFTCWLPSGASRADVRNDPCLIPWKPNARCTTPAPPAVCPMSGPIPVTHSCFTVDCATPTCNEGTCQADFGFNCPVVDAGPPDCEALRTTYVNALAAAQQCDPAPDASNCAGDYADACGCESPYDFGPHANAVMCAFDDWRNANCPVPSCGTTCAAPTSAGAACVPNASGTMGTCQWKR